MNATTDKVQEHECRLDAIDAEICNIKDRLDSLEERAEGWDACCGEIGNLSELIQHIQNILDDMNAFITWMKNHLPIMYEFVPADWSFAMGKINLYGQGNGITPNVAGNSIWTHVSIDGQGNITVPTAVAGDTYVSKFEVNLPANAAALLGDGNKVALGGINITSGGYNGNTGIFTRAKNQDNDLDFQ